MKVIDLEQGSTEWLEWRRNGITATDIAPLLGVSPYCTRKELAQKKREEVEAKSSAAMKRGQKHEADARSWAEEVFGQKTPAVCVESDLNPVFRASLDGIGDRSVFEFKVPMARNYEAFFNPSNMTLYSLQVQWQMIVAEKSKGYLVAYSPEKKSGDFKLITLNDERRKELIDEALRFWHELNLGLI